MVKLRQLIGSRREVYYECMYTKHKTQKRKVWQDGFVALYDTRRIVLFEEPPPEGKSIDEAKMNAYEWDRKDEEYISTPKFYIEVINETPIQVNDKSGETTMMNDAYGNAPSQPVVEAPVRTAVRRGGLSRGPSKPSTNTKFKSPVASNGALPPTSVDTYRTVHLAKRTASGMRKDASAAVDQFDFGRNPTSEWQYRPNAITRSPDEVAAIWFGDELFE